eukprot:CAMPEP_0171128320 /NCGR_PEP_ID=MMETSP0766_2-20121228/116885_1 /TAXON_ID=439317 /ORGANISM="Gambierdiscus australes, Strain CAWD 149" /LENGTH=108 /DNA_ID=CAMNT_0011591477 /DNA_START=405 /DNA_END=731 /DNA_ORIENTATION=-
MSHANGACTEVRCKPKDKKLTPKVRREMLLNTSSRRSPSVPSGADEGRRSVKDGDILASLILRMCIKTLRVLHSPRAPVASGGDESTWMRLRAAYILLRVLASTTQVL